MSEITYYRGDSYPIQFEFINKTTQVAIDITDYEFTMTVNAERDPGATDTPEFSVDGVITDGTNGLVSFTPTTGNTNIAAGTYWYDVEMVDTSSNVRTVAKNKFIVTMDITK